MSGDLGRPNPWLVLDESSGGRRVPGAELMRLLIAVDTWVLV